MVDGVVLVQFANVVRAAASLQGDGQLFPPVLHFCDGRALGIDGDGVFLVVHKRAIYRRSLIGEDAVPLKQGLCRSCRVLSGRYAVFVQFLSCELFVLEIS